LLVGQRQAIDVTEAIAIGDHVEALPVWRELRVDYLRIRERRQQRNVTARYVEQRHTHAAEREEVEVREFAAVGNEGNGAAVRAPRGLYLRVAAGGNGASAAAREVEDVQVADAAVVAAEGEAAPIRTPCRVT